MNFRGWIVEGEIRRPGKMAGRWLKADLANDESQYNQTAITDFTAKMADPEQNGIAIAKELMDYEVNQLRYDAAIGGNLVKAVDPSLQKAEGIVSSNGVIFAFFMRNGDRAAGSLLIQHTPLAFDQDDELLLSKIIKHELNHALFWLENKGVEPSGKYDFNDYKYASDLGEAKAYAQQLSGLLRVIKDPDRVYRMLTGERSDDTQRTLDALNKAYPQGRTDYNAPWQLSAPYVKISPFKMRGGLLETAKSFLNIMASLREWNTLEPSSVKAIRQADAEVERAAVLTVNIMNLLKFGNYITEVQ